MSHSLTSLFLSFLFYKMKKRKKENQTSKTKPTSRQWNALTSQQAHGGGQCGQAWILPGGHF